MEPHLVRVPLRWGDLDAQGRAGNARVVDYLQEARVDFLLTGDNAHLLGNGIIVVGHQVEYAAAIGFSPDALDVALHVVRVGAAQLTLAYQLRQGGKLVARARTMLANFDFGTGRPARFTAAERDWFTDRLSEVDPLREIGTPVVGEHYHAHRLVIRWSDLDAYGHVNNTRYLDYLAEARVALTRPLTENAIRSDPEEAVDHSWLVARQDLRYLRQIGHRLEPFEVRTALGATGRCSVTLAAEIVDPLDGGVMARATTVLVHRDTDGRPRPLPGAMMDAVRRWPADPREGGVS